MVRLNNKELALVVGIHPSKIWQGLLPAYDKVARVELSCPLTHAILMAEAITRVRAEVLANGITLPGER